MAIASLLELGRTGAMSPVFIIFFLALAVAVIAFIVFMERAQRRILVQYPKRQQGNRVFGGESSHLPLKLNTSGVIPAIFASSLLLLPATVGGFAGTGGPGLVRRDQRRPRLRAAAAHRALRRDDRVLLLLLHLDRLQPAGDRREPAQAWRLRAGLPAGPEDRRVSRLRADPAHRRGRRSTSPRSACCPRS